MFSNLFDRPRPKPQGEKQEPLLRIAEKTIQERTQTLRRYQRFVEWIEEGRHHWEPTQAIYLANHQVELEEQSKLTGELRRRTTLLNFQIHDTYYVSGGRS